ncbi:hypothetical protein GECvBMG_gp243c [Salmonella phage GEC_vB_MG]|uniref:Uncharacterized protein 204 n=2 Tax=Seunavirus TaxID=1914851 RepID=G3BM70_9CAUD|nr:HNH endonuclease [Salmonella phage PVPSE1]YP_009148919.1 HNH endonuclease [Salmonella phage SSE121]ADP02600.1 conserved hypothetical protein [Salmonella phage PVPSE1]AFU63764.1 hypothetical protein [Salmonella phage SSE121]QPI14787.1 hypothetical protein GECvBMG_gp243c [Salmonella phage GEC_vB_MG]
MSLDLEMESKPSTKHRSLVCGVGINDAPFITSMRKDGKLHHHTAYKDWHNMINRCYSGKYPSYHGVVVVDKWHYFMNFHTWWCNNYQQGYALDKDLLVEGNKAYGPDTCIYIPVWLNSYISRNGKHARGVTFDKKLCKFKAQRSKNDPRGRYIGYFDTEEEAHAAWESENIFDNDLKSLDISLQELVLKRYGFSK